MSNPSAADAADLRIPTHFDACEAPAYHLSQAIQAHGVFLALEPDSLRILRASANAGSIFALATTDLLGKCLRSLLAPASIIALQGGIDALWYQDGSPRRRSLALDVGGTARCAAFLYRSGTLACLEIEPPQTRATADAAAATPWFFDLVDRIARSEVASEHLPAIACDAIRSVSGFNRVYFCRFDRDGHGHVQGESTDGHLPSLLDHHFPATDIPHAARTIYVVNPFRLVPDIDAAAVPIIGEDHAPLDLTHSSCRAVAPSHLHYLHNMGVKAAMSFSLAADGKLAALLGGHHHIPRCLSFQQMAICQHLTELFAARLDTLRLREDRALLSRHTQALQSLAETLRCSEHDLPHVIETCSSLFCDLMEADDVICRFEHRIHAGRLLPPQQAGELLAWLGGRLSAGAEVVESSNLSELDATLRRLCPAVAGALAVSLDLTGNNIIAWLRREAVVTRTWAGNPERAASSDDLGQVGPRRSFMAYARQMTGTSRPWSSSSAGLARQLRATFSHVLSERYAIGLQKAAEHANTLKTEFLANISHELRSPMHAIIGFSEVLLKDDGAMPAAKRQRFLGTVIDSGRRLLQLIDELLDLSSLDAGKMGFAFQDGDPLTAIAAAVAEVDVLARAKHITISVHDDRLLRIARFDPRRLQQVMLNLLANALKFSRASSGIAIRLATTPPDQGPRCMLVEVADAGIGIPAADLDVIFEKFVQSSRTRTGAGGTGLGLAICRELIAAHGGRIWAANNQAGGASFFIELPQPGTADTSGATAQ